MSRDPEWSGQLSDIGGPTANLWGAVCESDPSRCARQSCLSPSLCPHLRLGQRDYLALLRKVKGLPSVKGIRVGSGIRHDVALADPEFLRGIVSEFVGGQLKVAPEHSVDRVLGLMRKTDFGLFERFCALFSRFSRDAGKEQYLVPYIMSAFPGCTVRDMQFLRAWFRDRGWRPQQVQCFIPTPGTLATAMFHAGCDLTGEPIHVARTDREREEQHSILVPSRRSRGGAKRRDGGRGSGRSPRRRGASRGRPRG